MSGSWSGIMRAPRVKVPLLLPLLLLLLLTALTGTVICQDDDDAPKEASATVGKEPESNTTDAGASGEEEDAFAVDTPEEKPVLSRHSRPQTVNNTTSEPVLIADLEEVEETAEGSGSDNDTSTTADSDEQSNLDPIMIIIPVVLVGLLICMIVCCILITCKWNKKKRNPDLSKEDPCLDGSSTEKVPMPMFEEDVPSVLELEMEELDQWMKKDGESTEDSKHV